MSEPAQGGGDSFDDGEGDRFDGMIVPLFGAVPATAAAFALLVPVRRGVDEPAVLTAAGFAFLALVVFFARRHGVLGRRLGGPIAAGSSLLVVVLSGYAINQGITGSTAVPGLDDTISLLFVAFAAAGGAVGVGVADYAGISASGLKRRLLWAAELTIVGFLGLVGMAIAELFVGLPALLAFGELTELQLQLVQYLSTAVGLGGVAAAYLAWRGYDRSFVDLEVPTLRSVGWIAGGLVLLFGVLVGISILSTAAGVDTAEHSTTQQVEQNLELLVVIVPAMVLIVGPFEELLYRNIVQKSLYGVFSRYGAVVVTSVIFASVHVLAYATAGPGQILASLAVLFGLSLVLGFSYERTDNLVVPAVVHGCYNAIQMAMLYFA